MTSGTYVDSDSKHHEQCLLAGSFPGYPYSQNDSNRTVNVIENILCTFSAP